MPHKYVTYINLAIRILTTYIYDSIVRITIVYLCGREQSLVRLLISKLLKNINDKYFQVYNSYFTFTNFKVHNFQISSECAKNNQSLGVYLKNSSMYAYIF